MIIKNICVFCGSSPGLKPDFRSAARKLGNALADSGIGLVYGGASVGLMGEVANAVLEKKGKVIGVIPEALAAKEVAFNSLEDLRIVGSMHERKAMMADLSDGFIALPGGIGTLEEFIEVLTWTQLGIHEKPCGLLNVCGFFDKLIEFLDHVVTNQFMKPDDFEMVLTDHHPETLLKKLQSFTPPKTDKATWALKMNER